MRVGVIGIGAIARRAHLPALASMEEVELVGLADVNSKAFGYVGNRFRSLKCYLDYREMLQSEIDAVIVCVPTPLHSTVVVDAAKAGKHVLVEKPLSLTVAQAHEIVEAAEKNSVTVSTVQNYRYFSAVQETRNRLAAGRIGRLLAIEGVCHTTPPMGWTRGTWLYQFGGVIDDFAPHLIDMACWFANSDIEEVHALGDDYVGGMKCINHAVILLKFVNGVLVTINASWLIGATKVMVGLYGTGGTIQTDITSNNLMESHGFSTTLRDVRSVTRKTLTIVRDSFSGQLFRGALQFYPIVLHDFFRSIEQKSPAPVPLSESVRVVTILDAARKDLQLTRNH